MTVALVGQPNSGKSTVFNSVAGYRSKTGNFPGTTVEVATSVVRLNGKFIELVDVPGLYSLAACDHAEGAAKEFLLNSRADVIINVLDASVLSRSLELTLELRELGTPMIVCLNMIDEAKRKGNRISAARLAEILGVPVVESEASRGEGVKELFATLATSVKSQRPPTEALAWSRDVEREIQALQNKISSSGVNTRSPKFTAIKLLEGDEDIRGTVADDIREAASKSREAISAARGRTPEAVIMSERHDMAMRLFEQVATVGRPISDIRIKIDHLVTHPFWGYLVLLGVFVGFFWAVFGFGSICETLLQAKSAALFENVSRHLVSGTLQASIVSSLWEGFVGGAAIILPYLVPFLFGLAILEDVGYLPRVAYLMDGLLHRIGLHGTSMLPLMLGYGCSVPACLATRILPSRRDRFLASILTTLVPCSARSNIILALVAFYLGPWWALGVYVVNLAVVAGSGWLFTRLWPEVSPGMVLEVPKYQWPRLGLMSRKVWLRTREFVVLSWPLLIGGSLVLGLAKYWHWDHYIDLALAPVTNILGLPLAVGTILVFGVLRKELSMIMLVQAMGTTNIRLAMSASQILVFTIFVTFYIPCLATIAALTKEIGKKLTALAIAYSFVIAITIGVGVRFLFKILPIH